MRLHAEPSGSGNCFPLDAPIISTFIETFVFNANSVDPDQTSRSLASDVGRHYLPLTLYGTPGINVTTADSRYLELAYLE